MRLKQFCGALWLVLSVAGWQSDNIFGQIPPRTASTLLPNTVEHDAADSPASDFDSQVNHWLLPSSHSVSDELRDTHDRSLVGRLLADQMNYYSAESLTMLGAGLVVGGAMANSSIDDGIHRHFQSSIRNANSDDWFESLHSSKELGNGKYTLPVMAGAWGVGELFPDSPLAGSAGAWGERSLRGILVGAPPLLAMQQLTGGSRPAETSEGSEWPPVTDKNGIS